jgi:hypothetical protein
MVPRPVIQFYFLVEVVALVVTVTCNRWQRGRSRAVPGMSLCAVAAKWGIFVTLTR